uniref:Odorant-binding protein n=1 Tax=Galleria mellonella TaxID=7137 RepID=A0A6G6C1X9_GALME|nr:odorant-binding protein [Galleria mellonella]
MGGFAQLFLGHVMECNEEFKIPRIKLSEMKTDDIGDIDPCLFACVFRNTGLLDDKGMYNPEVNDELKNAFETDTYIKKFDGIIKGCSYVNDKSVSDGAKGCERAVMVLYCLHEKVV